MTLHINGKLHRIGAATILFAALLAACGGGSAETTDIEVAASSGLLAPESAVHDTSTDTYLVSNIGAWAAVTDLVAKDNNGFISRIRPDGSIENLKWIAGGQRGVTLHSPRGLAVIGSDLWVADLDVVRVFDRSTGAPRTEIAIPGAALLNDVGAMPDGSVLVTDTGLRVTGSSDNPLGPDASAFAVYRVFRDGRVQTVSRSPDLKLPNGVTFLAQTAETLVVTYGGKDVLAIDSAGTARAVLSLPLGALDGIEALDDRSLLISAQEGGGAIYHVSADRTTARVLVSGVSGADIGLDKQRHKVLIPVLFENRFVTRAY